MPNPAAGLSPDNEPGPDGPSSGPGVPGERLLILVEIMDKLRTECPWDREQTHASLMRYLIEEAYETVDAIEAGDRAAMREELGDVLLQVLFHARLASEQPAADGGFTIDDVADTLAAKLVRRHPHVFGSVSVSSAADVNANWEKIKRGERAAKTRAAGGDDEAAPLPSVLDGVPFGQPALALAAQLQRRARRSGIAGPAEPAPVAAPASSPAPSDASPAPSAPSAASPGSAAGSAGPAAGSAGLTAEQLGDALMALVGQANAAGLDAELELRAAARRFADSVRQQERRSGPPAG